MIRDLHGVTGRDIMDHLIAGGRDPKARAQLAHAWAHRKIAGLTQTLEGAEFFTASTLRHDLCCAVVHSRPVVSFRPLAVPRSSREQAAGLGNCAAGPSPGADG